MFAFLLAAAEFHMLQLIGVANPPEMSSLSHFEDQPRRTWWRGSWCAVVALAAVCSLTVSVATRYTSAWDVSSPSVKTVQAHTTPEATRQRLLKDAANWVPPLVSFDVLGSPSSYPRITPAVPPRSTFLFETSLYNRPPPSSEPLV